MKNNFQNIGFAKLCSWFGITRQAYYQNSWKAINTTIEEELILQQVKQIRVSHPRLGTRKLYDKLQPFMLENSIKMGREPFAAHAPQRQRYTILQQRICKAIAGLQHTNQYD